MWLRAGQREWKCLRELSLKTNQYSTSSATVNIDTHPDVQVSAAKPFEDIPHLPILPFIGTAWTFLPFVGLYNIKQLHHAAQDKFKRFGDVYRDKFGPLNMVVSYRAEDMETIFKNEGIYPTRGGLETLKAYRESRKQWYSTTGLMALEGKEWHDLRSKTQKHLLKPKAIEAYMVPMQEVSKDLVEKIYKVRDSSKEVPNLLDELYKWALESVAFVGLDTRLGCLQDNLPKDSDGTLMINSVQTQFELMSELEGFSGKLDLWKYFPTAKWRRYTQAADIFTEIAFKYINRALDQLKMIEGNEDKELTLLQAMLSTKGLDASRAMVTVADMLMAGIDTTSHTVGFLLYHLAKNPNKQEKLYQEIMKVFPNQDDKMTTRIFAELKYLKACIKESQRLYPIIGGTVRKLDHDVIISGYRVPAKTMIVIGLQEIYVKEEYFKNPFQYYPERWLEKDKDFNPFSFLPFGFGTRSCIGRRLAELEIITLVTEIIKNFKIEYHHDNIGMITRFINVPNKPLRFNFIERQKL